VRAGRVAVVVAAGVGDNPRGDAAERVANGLSVFEGYDEPVQHAEWYRGPDDTLQPVDRFETAHAGTEVDIFEFWWADLSRFPAAATSFLAAFFGLFLALPSLGRTALRDDHEIGFEPQRAYEGSWKSHLDFHLLGFLAWVVSVPVVALTVVLLTTVAALAIAIALPEAETSGALAVGLLGVGVTVFGVRLLRKYEQESGRRGPFLFGLVALAGATALCLVRLFDRGVDDKGIELAIADTVSAFVAYPIRLLWLSVLALAVVVAGVLAFKLAAARRDPSRRSLAVERTVTAVLAFSLGPLGLALLMAILSAALGGLAQKIGPTVTWGPGTTGTPWCLSAPDSWTLGDCPRLSAWQFGTLTLGNAIFALAFAVAVLLGLAIVYGAAVGWKTVSDRLHRRSGSTAASRQASFVSGALDTLGGGPAAVVLLVGAVVGALLAAVAWLPLPNLLEGAKAQVGVSQGEIQSGWAPTIAAVVGTVVALLFIVARTMGLTPQTLATEGSFSNALRLVLDKPYDIATFLREPMGTAAHPLMHAGELPRQKMLRRYRTLLVSLAKRGYERMVFVAHSQGTVLTVTLLHDAQAPLPGRVSLMTFGCPLRQLYSERFPSQYAWVKAPAEARAFVPPVTETWINLGTAGDPIGRTVFADVPEPWVEGDSTTVPGAPALEDLRLGAGGHSSYWTIPALYARLAELIEAT
jgi:hypothetical protein